MPFEKTNLNELSLNGSFLFFIALYIIFFGRKLGLLQISVAFILALPKALTASK